MDRLGGGYQGGAEGHRQAGDLGYAEQYGEESYPEPNPRRVGDVPFLGPRSGVELPPLTVPTQVTAPYVPEPEVAPLSGALATEPPPPPAQSPTPPPPATPAHSTVEPEPPGGPRGTGGFHSDPRDRTTVRRSGGSPAHSNLYLARRAGLVGVLTAVAVVAELLLIRVLVTGEFGHTVLPGSIFGAVFAMAGIPLVTVGLYGLMTGVPAIAPRASTAWLRAPLAYLPVGLLLLLAAGIAVR